MANETSTSTSTGVASMPTSVYDASFASMGRPWDEAIEPSTQGDALAHRQKTTLAVDNSLPCDAAAQSSLDRKQHREVRHQTVGGTAFQPAARDG